MSLKVPEEVKASKNWQKGKTVKQRGKIQHMPHNQMGISGALMHGVGFSGDGEREQLC